MTRFFLAFAFFALTLPAQNVLQTGDVILASFQGLHHMRAGVSTSMSVVPGDMNILQISQFGNGAIETIEGTDRVLYAQSSGMFSLFLLEFSSGLANPTSFLLTNLPSSPISMSYDAENDVVWILASNGDVLRAQGPFDPFTTPIVTTFATGQAGAFGLTVRRGNSVVVGSSSALWEVTAGATAPAPPFANLVSSGLSDICYDPSRERILVSTFGSSKVEAYDAATGSPLATILEGPQLAIADSVDYDPSSDQVFATSRLAPEIGGVTFGQQPSFDNVVVCVPAEGPSVFAMGCSPMTGHNNAGVNAQIAVVRGRYLRLEFGNSTLNLNAGMGTLTGDATIVAVVGREVATTSGQDPLVGGAFGLNADFTGTDLVGLSDVAVTNANIDLQSAAPPIGTPDLSLTSPTPNNAGLLQGFAGPTQSRPVAVRRFEATGFASTLTTASSPTLSALDNGSAGRLFIDIDLGTGDIVAMTLNGATPTPRFETRVGTTGLGDLELGTIGGAPVGVLFHLVTAQLATPLGSGPFFGLSADPLLFELISVPPGTEPFFVGSDNNGQYFFSLPPGSAPAGLTLDYIGVSLQVGTGVFQFTAPRRVTF